MAAPRTTSLRALRAISKSTSPFHAHVYAQQTRFLRLTAPVEASPYLSPSQPRLRAPEPAAVPTTAPSSRQFNTSRALKSVNDSSTIDFAYFPDLDSDLAAGPLGSPRVPLLPEALYSLANGSHGAAEVDVLQPLRPVISTASGDSALSALGDVNVHDPLGDILASKAGDAIQQPGELRRLLTGLVEDIFGPRGGGAKVA